MHRNFPPTSVDPAIPKLPLNGKLGLDCPKIRVVRRVVRGLFPHLHLSKLSHVCLKPEPMIRIYVYDPISCPILSDIQYFPATILSQGSLRARCLSDRSYHTEGLAYATGEPTLVETYACSILITSITLATELH